MDLDDSFTEGLVQRVRARKEYLNKKKLEFTGKKRAVLIDEHQVNSDEPPNKSPKYQSAQTIHTTYACQDKENSEMQDDDSNTSFVPVISTSESKGLGALKSSCYGNDQSNKSPKWQSEQTMQTNFSTYDKENTDIQKENSNAPFVPSLYASRTKGLAALKKGSSESDDTNCNLHAASEFQVNTCDAYVYSTNSRDLCSGQKSRLANIAANIRQWEDETHKPTLSSKYGALSHTNTYNVLNQTNSSFMKLMSSGEGSSSNLSPLSTQSKKGAGTLSSCKQGNIEAVSVGGGHKKLQVWDQAVTAALENPISMTKSVTNVTKTSDGITKESEDGLDNEGCNGKNILENDVSGNSCHTKFDPDSNIKMQLGILPLKPTKGDLNLHVEKKYEADKVSSASVAQDSVTLDPAELPLSARKALFEKALMNGTPKVDKDITDHMLSVAERAAMFENASKVNSKSTRPNFKIPKDVSRTDLSKFVKNSSGSPVKILKPVVDIVKAPPVKEIVSPPLSSSLFPSKHSGLIEQKLVQNSDAQKKEMVVKVPRIQRQEISSLVHQWEKLSSSSSNEERKDMTSKEHISYESDDNVETSVQESEHDISNETENAVCEYEEKADFSDEDSDVVDVFNQPDAEKVSFKFVEEERISSERKDSSTSSQNTESVTGSGSQSYSGISSYTDDSSCASGCQSCTSGSSVRSYDVSQEFSEERKERNPEVPLLYTVSFYRKQKQETRLTPVRTIVHCNKESSPVSSDTDHSEYIQERIKALQDEILRQQTVISQTSQALNLCSCTAEFSGSMEQVEGERLLLIATQKRQACLNEVTRLKAFGTQGESVTDGKGTLTITDLQLPLKREFIASQLEGKGSDTVHYFLCLIRHGAQVIVTQMMSTDDKTSDGALCFTNHIQMQNLPSDFSVIFEVYALQTKKEVLSHEKKYHIKREHSKIRLTPKSKKSDGKILLPAISSPGGPNAVRSPSFGVVGYTRFTLLNCTKKTFTLDKVPFASPLEGVLRVRLQLHSNHKVMEKGFLTMFEDVSGFGAWHRRWCALDTSHLSFWKYPDDEQKKEPESVIDLKQCVTSQIKLAPRDICARPHTLQLVTVRPQEKGDKNTLISRSVNTLTTTRHLLSADTKEERNLWCNKLNEALANVRKWDPRALKPVDTM